MFLLVTLAVLAATHAAKLDNTYLPPSAQTSGGDGNLLQAPFQRQNNLARASNAYTQAGNGYTQGGNGYNQAGNGFTQDGNGYTQAGNGYNQAGNGFTQDGNGYTQAGNGYSQYDAVNERPRAALDRNAAILRLDNNNDGETYSYAYETENGIYAEESGVASNGVRAQGGYSYTGDDGQVYTVRYTADENGFVAQGDHLPTAPPVPEEILRALEQNARDEAAGIYDDGSYNAGKYGDEEARLSQQYSEGVVTDALRTRASFRGAPRRDYLPPSQNRDGYRY